MNYPTKKLGEVCGVVGGGTPSTKVSEYWGNKYHWVTPKDLGQLKSVEISQTNKQITDSGLRDSSAKLLPAGSVILSSRAPIGYVAINTVPMATNQGCRSFVCGPKVFNKYLYYFLIASHDYLQTLGGGSTFLEVSGSRLKEIEIRVPPIREQGKIVAKIERQFAKMDEAARLRAESEALAEKLLPAALHEIFSSHNWDLVSLSDVVTSFQYGSSKKASDIGEVVCVRMGNLQSGEIDWTNLKYAPDNEELEKFFLRDGDVLFNRTNSPELVGKTAIYRGDRPAIFAGYLIRINYVRDKVLGQYLNYCLNSDFAKDFCQRVKTDGVSQSNINAQKLATFTFPLPPLTEQKKIVKKLDALAEKVKALRELQAAQAADLKALKQSILHQAFSGDGK